MKFISIKLAQAYLFCLSIGLPLFLAACTGGTGSAAGTVEAYFQALVAKDADRLANLSCAAWEIEAQNELNSFGAVDATLEGLQCQETGKEGDFTLVSCTGKISADYNGEILEIDLSERPTQAAYEQGEWRMCGYR